MSRLRDKYLNEVRPKLMKDNQYGSIMEVPKLTKITVNMGVGEATQNAKALEAAVQDMTQITGQKPMVTRARKSISNFKLREGNSIGCAVTGCTSFSTGWSVSPCRASATSAVSARNRSTGAATTVWA